MNLPETMLRHLLAAVDPAEAAANSFGNFHTKGLTYINLLRTPALTAKLYVMEAGAVKHNAEGYLVNPHNHSYCFHTFVVQGWMRNVTFKEDPDSLYDPEVDYVAEQKGEYWERFNYRSPLRGGCGFEHNQRTVLEAKRNPLLYPGDSYYLRDDEIHTIVVPEDQRTILFLLQYQDVRLLTHYYQKLRTTPVLDGLYRKLQIHEVEDCLNIVRETL